MQERKQADQMIADLRRKLASGGGDSRDISHQIGDTVFTGRQLSDTPAKDLKTIADGMIAKSPKGIVVLISVADGKASIVVAVSKAMTDQINAVDLVRIGAEQIGGKGGGGRPDMAQAGGPDGDKAEAAITAILETAKQKLG
jgi:alanyl-tRNA synthetase